MRREPECSVLVSCDGEGCKKEIVVYFEPTNRLDDVVDEELPGFWWKVTEDKDLCPACAKKEIQHGPRGEVSGTTTDS